MHVADAGAQGDDFIPILTGAEGGGGGRLPLCIGDLGDDKAGWGKDVRAVKIRGDLISGQDGGVSRL